jgi:hypothetical protein
VGVWWAFAVSLVCIWCAFAVRLLCVFCQVDLIRTHTIFGGVFASPSALKHRLGIGKPLRGKYEARQFPLLTTGYCLLTTFGYYPIYHFFFLGFLCALAEWQNTFFGPPK